MIAISGIVVVIVAILGGYLMEHGNVSVLFQPSELIIIGGAAIGSFLISAPAKVVRLVIKNFGSVFKSNAVDKAISLELLMLLDQLFRKVRREGMLSIEQDVNDPENSPCFNAFNRVMARDELIEFICDNFKVALSGMDPHDMEDIMELDIEARHSESGIPGTMLTKVADSLPGLGIVAAVLGVVLTMGKINGPPAELGQSIGAALVGTFTGILMCYGFIGPMATNLELKARENETLLVVIKTAIVATVNGSAPQVALEYGRRAISGDGRPSIQELDEANKEWENKK
jgi:chemotaxis protein MotA